MGKVGIKNSVSDILKQKCPSDIPGERPRREQDVWLWSSEISCLGKVTLWLGFKVRGPEERAYSASDYRWSRVLMFGTAPGCKHFRHPHLQVETLGIRGVKCLHGVTSWVTPVAAPRTPSLYSLDFTLRALGGFEHPRGFGAEPWPSLALPPLGSTA